MVSEAGGKGGFILLNIGKLSKKEATECERATTIPLPAVMLKRAMEDPVLYSKNWVLALRWELNQS